MASTRPKQLLLTSLDPRKKHFVRKRRYALQFRDNGHGDVADQLDECEEVEVLVGCRECGKAWYVIQRCRLRVCPLCSYRESLKRSHFLLEITKRMKFPKLITLTTGLCRGNPKSGIERLRGYFNTLRKHKLFKTVKGGAYQIELKWKPEGWHIHIHVICDAPYIPYQLLWKAWGNIIGISIPQTDIRAAKSEQQRIYTTKYAAKAADFFQNEMVVVDWYEATKGVRLFATFGTFYNAKLEDLDPDGKFNKPIAVCPHCKSEGTIFLARDGPYLFGWDDWRPIERAMVGDRSYSRVIPEAKAFVDGEYKKFLQRKSKKHRQPGEEG